MPWYLVEYGITSFAGLLCRLKMAVIRQFNQMYYPSILLALICSVAEGEFCVLMYFGV